MKKINFKQPKYIIPTLIYIGALLIPYLFMEVFNVEIEDKKDANLQTTEYLNAMKNLPMQARFPAPTAGFSNIFTRLNKGFWRL